MLKFIRGKGQQPSAERQKLQNELFAFRKTVQHGFPHRASALAWDPLLRLAAVGTATGALKVYGRPGVEFYGHHTNADSPVTQIHFIPGTGRLVSVCEDNSLHLWEVDEHSVVEVRALQPEGKARRVSAACALADARHVLLGTEAGNVYTLELDAFALTDHVIYQDVVMHNCPEELKVSPGAVEAVCEHPTRAGVVCVGYARGLAVLWDRAAAAPTHTFLTTQQLESVAFNADGSQLTTAHNDGSYVTWDVGEAGGGGGGGGDSALRAPETPYGPYPCKPITKILMRTTVSGEQLIIFAGGMPRASYADKYTVTVQQGERRVAFDFTSRVIDLFTTTPVPAGGVEAGEARPATAAQARAASVSQPAAALVVLAEEELVVVDLCDAGWRPLRLPYLVAVHASAVTAAHLVDDVPAHLYDKLHAAGLQQTEGVYSEGEWPISGGTLVEGGGTGGAGHQLLLTGHEDGSVRFWDVGRVDMRALYRLATAPLFTGEEVAEGEGGEAREAANNEEEEWPPFRRVGHFDPYSDDPRLAVKKVSLCPLSGMLTVGGAAGHVVIAALSSTPATIDVKCVNVNIVSDRDGFVWKGHDQLTLRHQPLSAPPGYQVSLVVQLAPPCAVTALAAHWEWGVVCAGTAHGLALLDATRHAPVLHKCTLNPHDHTGTGDTPISRRKSFKKSLRESFRRLRKGRSQRRQTTTANTQGQVVKKTEIVVEGEAKPVERAVEARPQDDGHGSMLRCLYFARTTLIHSGQAVPTLWAGTNNGTVYAFTLNVPTNNKRKDEPVTCQLAKEIQLKHRAPVIGIVVLDGNSAPLPDPLQVEHGVSPSPRAEGHRVLIASEEQFKLFTLPSLKPYCKYKLTAHEGARVRRMSFAWFECECEGGGGGGEGGVYREWCLVCLSNLGDCLLLSVPELRRQLNAAACRKEDINGISTMSFSKRGEGLYLHSSSEFQRISLSATKVCVAQCRVPLAPWATALRASAPASTPAGAGATDAALNGDAKEEGGETAHDVTAASGDITVDSVRDHTHTHTHTHAHAQSPAGAGDTTDNNINFSNQSVNTHSMVVKTTTRTTQPPAQSDSAATPTTGAPPPADGTTLHTENIIEHSREEGVITRIETGTVTVPAGTDPKLILEMFDRQRSPLATPAPPPSHAAPTADAH